MEHHCVWSSYVLGWRRFRRGWYDELKGKYWRAHGEVPIHCEVTGGYRDSNKTNLKLFLFCFRALKNRDIVELHFSKGQTLNKWPNCFFLIINHYLKLKKKKKLFCNILYLYLEAYNDSCLEASILRPRSSKRTIQLAYAALFSFRSYYVQQSMLRI